MAELPDDPGVKKPLHDSDDERSEGGSRSLAAAAAEGDRASAMRSMEKALAAFELQGMQLHAAAMRRCLAQLGGDVTRERDAQLYFTREGVVDADAMTRMVAPAFDGARSEKGDARRKIEGSGGRPA